MLTPEIVKEIREQSLQFEQERVFSQKALEHILANNWFKLFVPDSLNGQLTTLPEALKIFEYASWVDGSFGWMVTIGAGGGYFAGYMQPAVAKAMFTPREAVVAGSGSSAGTATPTTRGYMLNGTWKYCSGALHATLFTANAVIAGSDDSKPIIRAFILLPEQVEIIPDWRGSGLRATESHTIVIKDQFVPEERTFSLFEPQGFADEPIYRYPFMPFAQATFAAICLGIARHLLEEGVQHAAVLREAWEAGNPERYSAVSARLSQAEQTLAAQSAAFFRGIEQSWQQHAAQQQQPLTEDSIQAISGLCQQTSRIALECGQAVIPYLGMSALLEGGSLNQIWRDLQMACQHSLLVPY